MDGDIRGTTGPGAETHSRKPTKIGPTLAGNEDMLHLGQCFAQTKLAGQSLTALSTIEEVASVVCV